MSDSILRIHATDPEYQPDEHPAARARDAAHSLFPGADQIDIEIYAQVTLIDCGENLDRITCPHCAAPRRVLTPSVRVAFREIASRFRPPHGRRVAS